MSRLRYTLLGSTLLVGAAGLAVAQQAPTYDPAQLPEVKGKVTQYTLTPRGDVDGLILSDGTEVHFRPQLSTELVFTVRPGDSVTIHGLKAKAAPMVLAASIGNDASGASITDPGPGGHGPRGAKLEDEGRIKAQLHTPRGDLNGVLLEDGTIVRMPPPEAEKLSGQLAVGQPLYVSGNGLSNALGKLILAREVGPSKTQLTKIEGPRAEGWGPRWAFWHHDGPFPHDGEHMHDGPHGDGPGDGPEDAPPPPAQ